MKKIAYLVERILLAIGVVALATVLVTVTLGIIFRYFLGSPFAWVEELSIFLFIWIVFLGASVAASRRRHVLVDILQKQIPPAGFSVLQVLINLLIVAFLAVLIYPTLQVITTVAGTVSTVLQIPNELYYLPVMIAGAYITAVALSEIVKHLIILKEKDFDRAEEEKGSLTRSEEARSTEELEKGA